jgi:hypothetical protein
MAPEYAMDGAFSVKSDTYSFGVIVLQIISGLKITLTHYKGIPNLLAYVSGSTLNFFTIEFQKNIFTIETTKSLLLNFLRDFLFGPGMEFMDFFRNWIIKSGLYIRRCTQPKNTEFKGTVHKRVKKAETGDKPRLR